MSVIFELSEKRISREKKFMLGYPMRERENENVKEEEKIKNKNKTC
jgi:hypothetical protein